MNRKANQLREISVKMRSYPHVPQHTQLGDYKVVRVLAVGGMGVVYEAMDNKLDRRAAVKVPSPRLCEDENARQRFLREAKMLAALKSAHVVTIYGVGEEKGIPFLAMEFLEGSTLEDSLRARSAPITVAELLGRNRLPARLPSRKKAVRQQVGGGGTTAPFPAQCGIAETLSTGR